MTNMSEREGLRSLLFEGDTTLVNLRCFRGEGPLVTHENICAQMRSAIQQKQDGTAIISKRFNDDAQKVDVRAWLAEIVR